MLLGFFQAFHFAKETKGRPTAIIAKTFKGKNFPEIEDKENWHGKPLGTSSAIVIKVRYSIDINNILNECYETIVRYLLIKTMIQNLEQFFYK